LFAETIQAHTQDKKEEGMQNIETASFRPTRLPAVYFDRRSSGMGLLALPDGTDHDLQSQRRGKQISHHKQLS